MVATYYYHYDALGSTERLTDASQNTTDTYTYTAFGDGVGGKNSTKNSYGWLGRIGYQFDGFGVLSAVRARWYKYDTGRWISQDPIKSDWNLYRYVANRSVTLVDPSGRASTWTSQTAQTDLDRALQDCEAAFDRCLTSGGLHDKPTDPLARFVCGAQLLSCQSNAISDSIASSPYCCASCGDDATSDIQSLLTYANTLSVWNVLDNCQAWAFKFEQHFPRSPNCYTAKLSTFKYPNMNPLFDVFPLPPLRHVAIEITLCNGTKVWVDNGWWGNDVANDHVFRCGEISPWVTPVLNY